MEDNKASVIPELCTTCGICVDYCAAKAKQIRNDLPLVKSLIKRPVQVIASLAPSFVTEYPDVSISQMISALKMLGFDHVSETALGAQLVSYHTAQFLKNNKGIAISSACPSVVEIICKHYPQHLSKITPIMSPLMAHGKMLKEHHGAESIVVFIGPCIAKKLEAERHNDKIDAAITFKELAIWLDEEGIDLQALPERQEKMTPYSSLEGALYPIDGGMIEGICKNSSFTDASYMTFSGQDNLHDILNELEDWEDTQQTVFLELLSCRGGCVNGPGMERKGGLGLKRNQVIKASGYPDRTNKDDIAEDLKIDLKTIFYAAPTLKVPDFPEGDIQDTLESIGKISDKDHLNCSGCGYDTCRSFAIALLQNKAESSMCVSYMRRMAHDKASVLLQKIPAAVIVVNDDLKIIEANRRFATLLGSEVEMIFDAKPRLEGAELSNFLPDYRIFELLLRTGKDALEREIKVEDKNCIVSVFSIQKHKLACGIILNLQDPSVQREFVKNKTAEVIRNNMKTVQKIAFLLGESASYTNSVLNSITESFNNETKSGAHTKAIKKR